MPLLAPWLLALTTLAQAPGGPDPAPKADARLDTALEQARACAAATVAGDAATLLRFTHPKVVAGVGGPEKFVEIMTRGFANMKDQGLALEGAEVDRAAALLESRDGLYCVLPMRIVLRLPQGRFRSGSFLVGVSGDQGASWTFVDGAPGAASIRKLLPNLPRGLKLPDRQPPEPIAEDAPAGAPARPGGSR